MHAISIRSAELADINVLVQLEECCFKSDRLTKRSFRRFIQSDSASLQIVEQDQQLLAYVLVLLHKGSVLARVYSLAVHPQAQGQGIAAKLMQAAEKISAEQAKLFLRLEVAQNNIAAINLYQKLGFKVFDVYPDYYADHQNALRMQKRLLFKPQNLTTPKVPWYQQTTDFTCGPAACMMAMKALVDDLSLTQSLELEIWREATTIYMTSGHGGCHPIGLALAMQKRGFTCQLYLNQQDTLFLDGVRSDHKRQIIKTVDDSFRQQAKHSQLPIYEKRFSLDEMQQALFSGKMLIILISTYRFDGKKAPHWVVVSGMDDTCVYLHDPDPVDKQTDQAACQYLPIKRDEFAKMMQFGKSKLRSLILLSAPA
ncbi:GNAT family N-acetyltransferase/peptidase C39 family protein [Gayadomonas joobiniege]|uniref:GNAT family N-acetyltransferase/peptidase C39 family protein n=1 Tax=Gayadomonas joobiniege TaxID=1234606 RepID=UPI000372CC3E|nr:GNAT family N-acetyltransferase/peptidase C39 family protein [Gayadomonas joobiniege]